jgi:hypothetical protein
MDYRGLHREFGCDLRLIGGIDLDAMRHGKESIRREIVEKVPPLLAEGGYVPLAQGADAPFEPHVTVGSVTVIGSVRIYLPPEGDHRPERLAPDRATDRPGGEVLFGPKTKFSEHLFSPRTKKGERRVLLTLEILWKVDRISSWTALQTHRKCDIFVSRACLDLISLPLLPQHLTMTSTSASDKCPDRAFASISFWRRYCCEEGEK